MKEKPNLIMITVACQLPDGQIIRHDRMVSRHEIECGVNILGYHAVKAYEDLDEHLDSLLETAQA